MKGHVFTGDFHVFEAVSGNVSWDVRTFFQTSVRMLVRFLAAMNKAARRAAIGVFSHFRRVREDPMSFPRDLKFD